MIARIIVLVFDTCIRALDSNADELIAALTGAGFTHLSLQIGKGTHQPTTLLKRSNSTTAAGAGGGGSDTKSTQTSKTATDKKQSAGGGGSGSAGSGSGGLTIECFDFRPSLQSIVSESSLVVSHAGAGSILEALRAKKPLLVVVNETLMDNHQKELADALERERYLIAATPATVIAKLTAYCTSISGGSAAQQQQQFKPFPGMCRLIGTVYRTQSTDD